MAQRMTINQAGAVAEVTGNCPTLKSKPYNTAAKAGPAALCDGDQEH